MTTGIPDTVEKNAVRILEQTTKRSVTVQQFQFIGGGSINHGGRLKTSVGDYFIKWNSSSQFPMMFEKEAAGLSLLKRLSSLHIPHVIGWFEENEYQGLVLEFVESKIKAALFWKELGIGLAALHKNSNKTFGIDHSNYIGSLQQINDPLLSWTDFFIEKRISVQLKLALEHHHFYQSIIQQFEKLYSLLPSIFPMEKPSLLHGDLWSGNVIVNSLGSPCLIDPAVYYGHREAEIAFTHLFGGFGNEFYDAYEEVFPIEHGFAERIDIYNLYPLLVHVNLFGGGYVQQVKSILKRFA